MKIEIQNIHDHPLPANPSWNIECIDFGGSFLFEGQYYIRAGQDNHSPDLSEAAGVSLDNGEVRVIPFGTQVILKTIKAVVEK